MSNDVNFIKKMFSHLYKEITESQENKISINGVRTDTENAEKEVAEVPEPVVMPDKFRHYTPSAVDFIRRCETEKQAEEIIDYLEKRGEITAKAAEQMRIQLARDGLSSFGPKKEADYYFKESSMG